MCDILCLLALCVPPAQGQAQVQPKADEVADLLRAVRSVGKEGAGAAAARAAWDKLVARGPAVLPRLLDALDTPDPVAANWLRTAFDRIADADLRGGGK